MNTDSASENRALIAHYVADGSTRAGCGKMGLELEHILIHRGSSLPVGYSDEHGVREILQRLSPTALGNVYEGASLIGLDFPSFTVTIEPAGQLEISIMPCDSLSCMRRAYHQFHSLLDPILDEFGLEALALGYHPSAQAHDLELIPKKRYRLMDAYFANTGKKGICMMRASASTQVSIDYVDEQDAILKFKIANLLGPLLAFITDNAPVFEGDPQSGRMARTRIWSDVDKDRCMVMPHLLENGFDTPYTFYDYAEHVMSTCPILTMQGHEAVSAQGRSADEIYDGHLLTTDQIEHLLSMFFPDVRLKHYIEIRIADAMPIRYALSYAALLEGLFYCHENLEELAQRFRAAEIDEGSVAQAKSALEHDAWNADVYGTPAWRWLDDLAALAWRGLDAQDREALAPLLSLIEHRTTLYDIACASAVDDETVLEARYRGIVDGLSGDVQGQMLARRSFDASSAYYHGELVHFGYIPYLIPPQTDAAFEHIVKMTTGILDKMISHYLSDPSYRSGFGFDPLLEKLICAPCAYEMRLPICRMDLFIDDEGESYPDGDLRFKFCEINTDGTSAMNEDREAGAALSVTPAFGRFSDEHLTVAQTLFDGIVRLVSSLYAEWMKSHSGHADNPRVAIVDFTESATSCEFEHFVTRFKAHGIEARICDAHELTYEDGVLKDSAGAVIDCIYRRAVTFEMISHADEIKPLLDALADDAVCCVGALRTQIGHCKRSFMMMRVPETCAFLDPEEIEFVRRHIPYTTLLDEQHADLADIKAHKDRWIVKPDDGYATHGVTAGLVVTDEEWAHLIDECAKGGFVVQEYCTQHATPNFRTNPDDNGVPGKPTWVMRNRMVGLYAYGQSFAGVYVRAGSNPLIGGPWDSDTLPAFHVGTLHRPR